MLKYLSRIVIHSIFFLFSAAALADSSSRAFYQLSDRPLTALDLGFYRMELDINDKLRPVLADLLNTRTEQVAVRDYLTVGQTTDMVLVIEASLKGAFDSDRSLNQAKNLCEKITNEMAVFYFKHPLIKYFESRDPFADKMPKELEGQLEEALRLSAIVSTGAGLPEHRCIRPLNFLTPN
jgi:hypothetical protein